MAKREGPDLNRIYSYLLIFSNSR